MPLLTLDKLKGKIGFFGRKEKGVKHLLALDIGTEFVKALVFAADLKEEKGEVLGVSKVRQKVGNMQAAAVADIEGVTAVCREAILQALAAAKKETNRAIIGIAGEYVRGAATVIAYQREKPEDKIDLPELKNIVQKVQWQAFNKIRRQLAEEINISEIEIKLLNAAIVDVRIDGYQVTSPLGFQGRELSLTVFNVYAPMVHLGAIETIAKSLKLDLISVAAEPYAIARSIDLKNKQNFSKGNAIIVDIGGGTTDVALIRNGAIEGVRSFAIGGQAFTKRLGGILGLSFQQAEEVKLKYSQGEVGKIVKKKITETFKKDLAIWTGGLSLILEEFAQNSSLPSNILLCGGGSFLPGIKKALEDFDWAARLPLEGGIPEILFINPEDIENIKDLTGTLKSYQDITPMSLASLAIEIEKDKETTMGSIVKRAVRLIQS